VSQTIISKTETTSLAHPTSELKTRWKPLLGPDWLEAYLFILPAAILLGAIVAIPFLMAFFLSFTNTHTVGEVGPLVGLRNYVILWQDQFFRSSVWITLRYTLWTVLFKFGLGLGAALLLHRLKRWGGILTGLVLLPWVLPEVVRAVTWKGMLDPLHGLVNRLLLDVGLIERAIPFFGDVRTAFASVVLVNVWAGVPLLAIMLLAGLKSIDTELYEAAAIDGANSWRQFLHITLPGLRYVIIVVLLLSTIWSFNEFTPISVMTRGGPVGVTTIYTIRVYEAAQHLRYSVGVAMGMTLFPLLGIFILLLSRYMIAGNQVRQEGMNGSSRTTQLLYPVSWLFRWLAQFLVAAFWLINNAAEWLVEKIGAILFPVKRPQRRAGLKFARQTTTGGAGLLLIALLIFELLPFYWVIITSFKSTLQITTFSSVLWPESWTLEQYKRLLGPERNFALWYSKTLVVSLVAPLIATFVGAFSAYGLARLRWRGSTAFSSFVMVAYLLPGVILLIPLLLIFQNFGLINSLWSLIIAYPSFTLPFALWMMMGYYTSIPEEIEDAALIDGCTRFQLFTRVVLPLVKPALVAIYLFGMIHAWGEFLFASVFLRGDMNITLPVGLASMVLTEVAPWGEVAAASILLSIPVFVFFALGQKFMVEGLTKGAVKGS
jgi:multiple sugar transport system permease protein